MPTGVIELGTADLYSRESGISVELKSSAEFASSAEDAIDQLRRRLTAVRITDQGNGKPWIHRGNSFELVISLHLRELLGTRDQDDVVQILSKQIQKTKLLQQLRLTPSSVQSSDDGGSGAYIVTTQLTYDNSTPSPRRQLHKLGADVPFHDVRPPSGVTEVSCEAVHISLALAQARPRKRKRRQAIERPDKGECGEYQDICDDSQEEILEDSGLSFAYDGTAASLFLSEPDDMILDTRPEHDVDELNISFDDELPVAAKLATDGFALDLPKPLPYGPISSIKNVPTTEGCVRAIEGALQLAICGSSPRSRNGFSVDKDCSICPLADTVPSIWSPDYLPSVANRAVFLPTIAHALESVLQRAADKTEIESFLATDVVPLRSRKVTSQGGTSLVPRQLWERMQHLLYSENAVCRLSPLCEPAENGFGDYGVLDELLDGGEAYSEDGEMLDPEGACNLADDDRDDIFEDEICDTLGDNECIVTSDSDEEALADNPEEDSWLDGLRSSSPYQTVELDDGYRSSTRDNRLDQAKAGATPTWQGGDFRLNLLASQSAIMPSQSHVSTDDRKSCKSTKQPAAVSDSSNTLWLPDEEGRHFLMSEDLMFEDDDGDEMLTIEADMRSIPSDWCEMLCI